MDDMLEGVELLLIGNDNTVSIEARAVPADMFADDYSGALISGLTPQVRVQTAAEVDVSGVTWPVNLTHDATEGQYNGVGCPATAVLTHQTAYIVKVTIGSTILRKYPAVAWNATGIKPTQAQLRTIANAAGLL